MSEAAEPTPQMGSSRTDRSDYRLACAEAARSPASFDVFRQDLRYRKAVEHVRPEHAQAYLSLLQARAPHLARHIETIRRNDGVGGPLTHDFGGVFGVLSPNTCRYAKVLADLIMMFGSLEGLHIVEVGGGYGGQCAVIQALYATASYTIIDLPEANELQREFLRRLDVNNVTFVPSTAVCRPVGCDLFLSNYALTECSRPMAAKYLDQVVRFSGRGYVTGNMLGHSCYSRNELMQLIPHSILLPEEPLTHPLNYLLVWKTAGGIRLDP